MQNNFEAGRGALAMRFENNTMAFDYSPVFYFHDSYGFSSEQKQAIVADCIAAYKRWEGDYDGLAIKLNIHPSVTEKKRKSNVRFLPDQGTITTMVPRSLIWSPRRCCNVYYRKHDMHRMFTYVAQHELGHVLGIFDAYGYGGHFRNKFVLGISLEKIANGLLPEASFDLTPRDSIMRSGTNVTALEARMILRAWQRGRLQLYCKSALTKLGGEVFGGKI